MARLVSWQKKKRNSLSQLANFPFENPRSFHYRFAKVDRAGEREKERERERERESGAAPGEKI